MGRRTEAIFNKQEFKGDTAKISSYRAKFLAFVASEHSKQMPLIPIFPISLDTLMVFATWCSENGIKGGMDSISNYVGEVAQWAVKYADQADPRFESAKAIIDWRTFCNNFRLMVKTERKLKLRIQPAMFQAIMQGININDWRDMRDGAQYCICYYTAARIGHTAVESTNKPKHLLRFKDLLFEPSLANPDRVFILLRSTKTRKENESRPTWHAVGKVRAKNGDKRLCPVFMLQRWFQATFKGDPEAPLFTAEKEGRKHLPCGRTEFGDLLKARLINALPLLDIEDITAFDISKYSGIGFRKGSLSALAHSKGITTPRLAAHGDHRDVNTTMHYLSDCIEQRAANSSAIASHFGK